MRILILEDDTRIADDVRAGLLAAGHTLITTGDGREGLFLATGKDIDIIILDRLRPGLDGLDLLRLLRGAGLTTPVLALSTLTDVEQRVASLRDGADDYLMKPVTVAELLARLTALLHRPATARREEALLVVADLEMDLRRRTVRRGGQAAALQPREFRLLEYLMRHADEVVTRARLLEAVWDAHCDASTNVLDVQISRLRQKIDRDRPEPLLHTVRGAGYRLGHG